ncbi:Tyrosine--tRNA ligase [Enhygromyxa salina]|uniref:Tyrosine--tRNA ligase n=1 Tax=Enhygromyxa salina TaxID=215803 RepID=A0A2S9XIY6_9BACT|nr:tyrosine--tRNA ligase [Enhygromyxa salina]PRP92812.1 Tyrosine--tRNA ligase [Enhygromyxa salina]
MSATIDDQVRALMRGTDFGDEGLRETASRELAEALRRAQKEGRGLRVYTGYDPTRPDLHIGHAVTLRKMRQFQDFGHDVIFLVGTFTAQVGDTSDKATGRPRLDADSVREAGETYAEQAFKVLDRERTRVVFNGDWLAELPLAQFIDVAAQFTVQQFLGREAFRKRVDAGNPIGLHELLYALLQGYDAVHLRADVQLGATEQLYNLMAGRRLQIHAGQPPCVCMTMPILVGTDGVRRMSKSQGNTIGLDDPPVEQYGKAMSISDETMVAWLPHVTRWVPEAIDARLAQLGDGTLHPMELKKQLAREIVAAYHGDAAADEAAAHFSQVHQRKQLPDDMPTLALAEPRSILDAIVDVGFAASRNKARRLLDGGAVKIDGVAITDHLHALHGEAVVQVGKRRFFRVAPQ